MATTRRIALVTGGMGGLGEAICIKLAKLGDTVATTYSPGNTKSEQWLTLMREQGYQFYAYPCDVADWESCRACIRKMTEALGPQVTAARQGTHVVQRSLCLTAGRYPARP